MKPNVYLEVQEATDFRLNDQLVEMIVTVVIPATKDEPAGTKIFRFEFETEDDALGFIDTSEDIPGLVHGEFMRGTEFMNDAEV
jgi:hypothetical protein